MNKCNNRRKHLNILSEKFSQDRFKLIFKNSPVAIFLMDASGVMDILKEKEDILTPDGTFSQRIQKISLLIPNLKRLKILDVNKSAINLLEVSGENEFISKFISSISKTGHKVLMEALIFFSQGMNFFEGEISINSLRGMRSDCLLRVSVPNHSQKTLSQVIVTLVDITARKEMERHLRKMAQLDGLTKLLNHYAIIERLNEELNRSKRYGIDITCLMIDVDRFKLINDKLGHQKGDQILKKVATLIKANLRRTDIVGRYGGDEFLVILPETKSKNAKIPAYRIQESFQQVIMKSLRNMPFQNTLSIGVCGYPSKGINSAKDLIERADQAMYKAKNMGRDRVVIV